VLKKIEDSKTQEVEDIVCIVRWSDEKLVIVIYVTILLQSR